MLIYHLGYEQHARWWPQVLSLIRHDDDDDDDGDRLDCIRQKLQRCVKIIGHLFNSEDIPVLLQTILINPFS
jgi:hypothetical protein